ncbi:MAG: hypothetical protein EB023_04350 [Flavobacteriia bacterium]|nr:hypothetical protein [Flavobacteriia bacterium]
MSHDADKFKNSKRRLKDNNAVNKQVNIAKAHELTDKDKAVKRTASHSQTSCHGLRSTRMYAVQESAQDV